MKKEPITAEILQKLYDKFVSSEADLSVIRTMAICLLGYAGFFRFSELASLRECDVKFYDDHLEVFVPVSGWCMGTYRPYSLRYLPCIYAGTVHETG